MRKTISKTFRDRVAAEIAIYPLYLSSFTFRTFCRISAFLPIGPSRELLNHFFIRAAGRNCVMRLCHKIEWPQDE